MLAPKEASMTSERMSPVDTAWLHMDEPENPADIVTLLSFDGRLSYGALKRVVEERLLKYNRFRQRVTERDGHPTWEDDPEFHIERHVTRYELVALEKKIQCFHVESRRRGQGGDEIDMVGDRVVRDGR
jgi:hypothetical protein